MINCFARQRFFKHDCQVLIDPNLTLRTSLDKENGDALAGPGTSGAEPAQKARKRMDHQISK